MIFPSGILFDLDGVIYQGETLVDGAKSTIRLLDEAGIPYCFITNSTRRTKSSLIVHIEQMGLKTELNKVFAAPHAAIEYCKMQNFKRMLLIVPDPEMKKDFFSFDLVDKNPEVIVLGDMGSLFSFELLNRIFIHLMDGCQIVAMHKNRYWVDSGRLRMDLGAFVSALEYASGRVAIITGKPNRNFFMLAVRHLGCPPGVVYMVGDDIDADICGAKNAGINAILVKTGKFNKDLLTNSKIQPDYIIESVADLPRIWGLN